MQVVTEVVTTITPLKVIPSDWLTNPLSVNSSWQIWYRYNGKLVKVTGMNREKDYRSRVQRTIQLIKDEEERLTKYGFNPIDKTYLINPRPIVAPVETKYDNLEFLPALQEAFANVSCEHSTKLDIKSCLKYFFESTISIGYDKLPINQVSKRHIKLILNDCEHRRSLSPHMFNKYRSYLMVLFDQLEELDVVEYNPVKAIKKRKMVFRPRKTLVPDERELIKQYLARNYPAFYRFVQIFFHSGARVTELLSLKVSEVDLIRGEFLTLVKKGNNLRYVTHVIKDIVKQYWIDQISLGNSSDFVFSYGLLPGGSRIRREQVTRRWNEHVKKKLGIKADFYSLKHLNSDETAAELDLEAAARHVGHTTTQVTKKHYALGEEERQRQRLKQVFNPL